MTTYLVLLRGVNVGVKSRLSMADLRRGLEELGFYTVSTYIASGNVILESDKPAEEIKAQDEEALSRKFKLDDETTKAVVLTPNQLQAIIDNRPEGFGDQPEKYHSGAIFLIDIAAAKAMSVFDPREGVDPIWPGQGAVYSQRLSAERTRSRLSKIAGTPVYRSMTIRSWSTTTRLHELMKQRTRERPSVLPPAHLRKASAGARGIKRAEPS